jgi:hypothetical protein
VRQLEQELLASLPSLLAAQAPVWHLCLWYSRVLPHSRTQVLTYSRTHVLTYSRTHRYSGTQVLTYSCTHVVGNLRPPRYLRTYMAQVVLAELDCLLSLAACARDFELVRPRP